MKEDHETEPEIEWLSRNSMITAGLYALMALVATAFALATAH